MAAAKEEEFHAQLAIYRARQAQKVKAAGAAPAEASSAHTPSPKKRAPDDIVEVLDSDDDADGNTTEGDEALARRLQAHEAAPRLDAGSESDASFDHLASLVMFQRDSRSTAESANRNLHAALGGGPLTPRALLGVADGAAGVARMMRVPGWEDKATTMLNLAREWSSLRAPPRPRCGPRDAADKEFEKSAKTVKGVGPWTVSEFLLGLKRTDILQHGCYEVKTGLKHLLQADGKPTMTVTAWSKAQGFRPENLTRVTNILRGLHRAAQADRAAKGRACARAQAALQAL